MMRGSPGRGSQQCEAAVGEAGDQTEPGGQQGWTLLCAWVRDAYRVLPELTGRPHFGTRP